MGVAQIKKSKDNSGMFHALEDYHWCWLFAVALIVLLYVRDRSVLIDRGEMGVKMDSQSQVGLIQLLHARVRRRRGEQTRCSFNAARLLLVPVAWFLSPQTLASSQLEPNRLADELGKLSDQAVTRRCKIALMRKKNSAVFLSLGGSTN